MRSIVPLFLALQTVCVTAGATTTTAVPWLAGPAAPPPYALARTSFMPGAITSVPESVSTDLARRIHRIEKLTRRLSSDEGFLRSADEWTLMLLFNRTEGKAELLREYAPSFDGAAVPDDLFATLDTALDGLWQEITRLAPTYAQESGHPVMRSLATALEQRLRVTVPKATFVGGMLREKEWRVKLSALGLPESRAMSGVVFYRMPDQQWLICREFEVAQRYFKRDHEGGSSEITFGCLRLQA